jgi:uncharacterized membrane protein YvlD (DUF360 family)
MTRHFLTRFAVRWMVSGLGLWIASGILGSSRLSVGNTIWTVIGAGFFLALVLIVHWIYSPLYVKNLGVAILAGIIIGLVNFLVTKVLEDI